MFDLKFYESIDHNSKPGPCSTLPDIVVTKGLPFTLSLRPFILFITPLPRSMNYGYGHKYK